MSLGNEFLRLATDDEVALSDEAAESDGGAGAFELELECQGHESLNGPMGTTVYCDGSCRTP